MNGIELIAKERSEQIEKHGYTFDHDLEHGYMTLLNAAAAYMFRDPYKWPFEPKSLKLSRINIDNYKKAGAFVAAAMDVLIGPNTAAPVKTLQECKDEVCQQLLGVDFHIALAMADEDDLHRIVNEVSEMYANQPKASVKVVTDEEIKKASIDYRNADRCTNHKYLDANTMIFQRGAEWMRKQLTGE